MRGAALVLGGGFAGLSAAIHLALAGFEVTLLEGHAEVGGKAGEVMGEGFRFDTGPSVLTLPGVLEDLFAAAGESLPFELHPLEPLCRYCFPSGRVWNVFQDVERTTAQLSTAEARVYCSLLAEAKALYEAAAPTFVYGSAPGPLDLLKYGLKHGLKAHPFKTLPGLLERHGAVGDLKSFFLRFATYFGADPTRAPAVLHNIAWVELGLGVIYPEGGIKRVVRELAALATRLGVDIKTGAWVERLELSSNKVREVQTSAGNFSADVVVSSLDIVRTHKLLGRRTRLEGLEPSLSGFVLLLGVEGETPELAHHTILFPENYPAEFAAIRRGETPRNPTLYVSVGAKTDPSQAPPGCENLFVMANAPALPVGAPSREADADGYADHLLEVLERRGLPLRDRVRFRHTLSPDHLATLAHRGSIYGVAPHSLLRTLRPKGKVRGVKNLFLAGGSVHPGGGVPLALLSGKEAASLGVRYVGLG